MAGVALAADLGVGQTEANWQKVKAIMVAQGKGLDDAAVLEVMAAVDLFSGFNKLMDGLQVEPDEKPWYG